MAAVGACSRELLRRAREPRGIGSGKVLVLEDWLCFGMSERQRGVLGWAWAGNELRGRVLVRSVRARRLGSRGSDLRVRFSCAGGQCGAKGLAIIIL